MDEKYKIGKDGVILMLLESDNKYRMIGKIEGTRFVRYEDENGLHQLTDSFSLPYSLLAFLRVREVDDVMIVYEDIRYLCKVDDFYNKGQFLYFKDSTEKKKYLKREHFYKLPK